MLGEGCQRSGELRWASLGLERDSCSFVGPYVASSGFDRTSYNFTGLVGAQRGSWGIIEAFYSFGGDLEGVSLSKPDALALSPPFLFYSLGSGCGFRVENVKKNQKANFKCRLTFKDEISADMLGLGRHFADMTLN